MHSSPLHAQVAALNWLVEDASPNDALFFHCESYYDYYYNNSHAGDPDSGHGGNQADADGDEIDGFDETIVPVDAEESGQITDDVCASSSGLSLVLTTVFVATARYSHQASSQRMPPHRNLRCLPLGYCIGPSIHLWPRW